MNTFRFILVLTLIAGALALNAGCETMKGVGKDIQDASTSVQQSFAQ